MEKLFTVVTALAGILILVLAYEIAEALVQ